MTRLLSLSPVFSMRQPISIAADGFFHFVASVSKTIFRSICPARSGKLRLTGRGASVARKLDAENIAANEMPKLLKLKGVSKNATPLEVQVACMNYALCGMLDSVDRNSHRKIQDEIHSDSWGAPNVLPVFGVVFRDAVFRELNIDD